MTAALATAPAVAWPLRAEPWDHQLDALAFAADKPAVLLNHAMSAGKTATAIALAEHARAMRVLVVCPKSVVGVWPRELAKHAVRDWRTWAGEVHGRGGRPLRNPSVARRAEALADAARQAAALRRPLLACVNYEAMPAGAMGTLLMDIDWDLVVADESHRAKSPGGKQSRYLARVCERTRSRGGRILALTGTPMPHSPLDLYGQYRALDPTILGTSNAAFRARYGARKIKYFTQQGRPVYLTTPGGQPIYDGVRYEMRGELMARVGAIMHTVTQAELDAKLGLEEPTDSQRTCELSPAARRVYDDLERHGIAELETGVVTAANAMVLVTRLAQAANGFARQADSDATACLTDGPTDKARLLSDVLEDIDTADPVVVFCRFHHDLDQIRGVAERQGRRYAELSGRRRDGLTAASELTPDADLVGVQLKSGGVGVDLTRARVGVYYSNDWALGEYLQSRKRLHRHGQQRHVTFVHLIAEDTIDAVLYQALERRQQVVDACIAHLAGART